MSNSTSNDWTVVMPMGGRDGYISYHEGARVVSFYWEFGGGDVVAIIYTGQPSDWSKQYPWAADRRHEILERVTQDVIRQRAPTCKADTDKNDEYIYLREHNPPSKTASL